jgi:hypothetical protein
MSNKDLIPASEPCSCDGDPIECTHQAALAQAEEALARVVELVKNMPDWCSPREIADSLARAILGNTAPTRPGHALAALNGDWRTAVLTGRTATRSVPGTRPADDAAPATGVDIAGARE